MHSINDKASSSRPGLCVGPSTTGVQAGLCEDLQHGAVVSPLYLSSNFTFAGFDQKRTYDYTRSGNPTRDQLAAALAEQEGGRSAVICASGMAAIALTLQLLRPGDRLVAAHDLYGGAHRLLTALAAKGAFDLEFLDLTTPGALGRIETLRPQMVWAETPSNPLLRITDLQAVSDVTHAAGGRLVVDNTFLSPALQRPIAFGADVVVHSTTKYINGHGDVVGGAVIATDADVGESMAWWANCLGVTGSPFDSYLTLRGLRTLRPRLRLHEENARQVVSALERDDRVSAVYYPGRPEHPGHEVAARQQDGFGGMVSFELVGGRAAARSFVEGVRVFRLAESLGGVESLIAHPSTMTHASMDEQARVNAGISDGLLRLSVGIEDAADLVADLQRGLDGVPRRVHRPSTRLA